MNTERLIGSLANNNSDTNYLCLNTINSLNKEDFIIVFKQIFNAFVDNQFVSDVRVTNVEEIQVSEIKLNYGKLIIVRYVSDKDFDFGLYYNRSYQNFTVKHINKIDEFIENNYEKIKKFFIDVINKEDKQNDNKNEKKE